MLSSWYRYAWHKNCRCTKIEECSMLCTELSLSHVYPTIPQFRYKLSNWLTKSQGSCNILRRKNFTTLYWPIIKNSWSRLIKKSTNIITEPASLRHLMTSIIFTNSTTCPGIRNLVINVTNPYSYLYRINLIHHLRFEQIISNKAVIFCQNSISWNMVNKLLLLISYCYKI